MVNSFPRHRIGGLTAASASLGSTIGRLPRRCVIATSSDFMHGREAETSPFLIRQLYRNSLPTGPFDLQGVASRERRLIDQQKEIRPLAACYLPDRGQHV